MSMNKKALSYWESKAENVDSPKTVKVNDQNDHTDIDAKFILKYCNPNTKLLEMGAGTGLIVNKIYKSLKQVVAVEKFKAFSDFIIKDEKIQILNIDFNEWNSDEKFNIIIGFGFMHYFDEAEAIEIYRKIIKNLAPDGKLIIKNQFGVSEDVTVSGFSNELNREYFSQYRWIEKEKKILQDLGLTIENVEDIYTSEMNRWDNTHFYAIVAAPNK